MIRDARKLGLKIGIIGTGAMAGQMAQAIRSVSGVSVSAVLSREAGRAKVFCDLFARGAVECTEVSHLLDIVDAVYIATPSATHTGFVDAAIGARKPVLCEKPLTTSSKETLRLLARARSANVLLVESIWTLALPAYRELKSTFGARRDALLQFDFSYPIAASAGSHLVDPGNGGVLIDRSVYGYAAAISLLGDVTGQTAWVTRDDSGLETSAELRLEHDEGARSFITLSFDRIGPNLLHVANKNEAVVLGPYSLAAETLHRVAYSPPLPASPNSSRPSLRARLKASPILRAAMAKMPNRGKFLGYGASCYVPVVQEFLSALERGDAESAVIPHALSEQISTLTEDARKQ